MGRGVLHLGHSIKLMALCSCKRFCNHREVNEAARPRPNLSASSSDLKTHAHDESDSKTEANNNMYSLAQVTHRFSLLYSLFTLFSSLFLFSRLSSLFLSPSRALTLVSRPPPHHWAIKPLSKRGLMAPAVARPVDCSRARKRDEIKTESRAA